ncbi:hypothetical protein DPMN_042585, partial [Dreissena polymorpha]
GGSHKFDREIDFQSEKHVLSRFYDYWARFVTYLVVNLALLIWIPNRATLFQMWANKGKLLHVLSFAVIININKRAMVALVAHLMLTRKTAPPPDGHVFHRTATIFKLSQDILRTNVPTKFHEDWTKNVTSTENCPPPGDHVVYRTATIFELSQDILRTNVPTKFREDWNKIVTSTKNCPAHGGHVFLRTGTIFKLSRDICRKNVMTKELTRKTDPPHWRPYLIGTNVLTKFHEDWTKNVTPRPYKENHVFQPTRTIFELVQVIIRTHVLTKFHEDWTINVASSMFTRKTATPPGSHVFQPTATIFVLKILLGHINVASRVFTRKTAMPPGGHVFQPTGTIFELVQDIIGKHVLTKFFHEDWTINVNFDDGRRTKSDHTSSP